MKYEMIVNGLNGLIGGAIGSLIAPWIHWGIEKRKIRHQKRIDLFKEVREYVQRPDYDRINFRETVIYSQIKVFLDSKIVKKIENPSNEIIIEIGKMRGSGIQNYKNEILDNLTKIENRWKIF